MSTFFRPTMENEMDAIAAENKTKRKWFQMRARQKKFGPNFLCSCFCVFFMTMLCFIDGWCWLVLRYISVTVAADTGASAPALILSVAAVTAADAGVLYRGGGVVVADGRW